MNDLEKLKLYYNRDYKRPFGNSDIEMDVADILGWKLFENADGEKMLTKEQFDEAQKLTEAVRKFYGDL